MTASILALLLAVPCPPGVDPAACGEQDACVVRVYQARTASSGVSAREAALVSRLDAERACSLVAWSAARSSSAALQLRRSIPPLVPPPACSCPEPPACSALAAALIAAGSCAACGGGAAAVCGVAR